MSIIHDIKQPGNIDVATVTDSTQQASNSKSIYRAGAVPMGYQTDVLPRVGECNKRSIYVSTRIFMTSLGLKTRSNNNTKKLKFDRSKLPSPESFWALHGIRLKLKKGWVMEESRTCTTGSTVEGRSHGYQDNL